MNRIHCSAREQPRASAALSRRISSPSAGITSASSPRSRSSNADPSPCCADARRSSRRASSPCADAPSCSRRRRRPRGPRRCARRLCLADAPRRRRASARARNIHAARSAASPRRDAAVFGLVWLRFALAALFQRHSRCARPARRRSGDAARRARSIAEAASAYRRAGAGGRRRGALAARVLELDTATSRVARVDRGHQAPGSAGTSMSSSAPSKGDAGVPARRHARAPSSADADDRRDGAPRSASSPTARRDGRRPPRVATFLLLTGRGRASVGARQPRSSSRSRPAPR